MHIFFKSVVIEKITEIVRLLNLALLLVSILHCLHMGSVRSESQSNAAHRSPLVSNQDTLPYNFILHNWAARVVKSYIYLSKFLKNNLPFINSYKHT